MIHECLKKNIKISHIPTVIIYDKNIQSNINIIKEAKNFGKYFFKLFLKKINNQMKFRSFGIRFLLLFIFFHSLFYFFISLFLNTLSMYSFSFSLISILLYILYDMLKSLKYS